jgi:Zn-dependent peptidase ImmA (M78 family)
MTVLHLSEQLATIRQHQNRTPVPVIAMARALGIEVYQTNTWPDELSGMIKRWPEAEGGFRITFNANHPKVRQRFTVAHEIAHAVLHPEMIGDGITDDAMWRSGLPQTAEYQANRMAADILMPEHLVREKTKNGLWTPATLARQFEVSNQSMTIRLESLGLI